MFMVRLFSPLRIYQKVIVNNGLCEGRLIRCTVNLEALYEIIPQPCDDIALSYLILICARHLSTLCLDWLDEMLASE